jgi:glycosyltransferase involved in cell wall biosynthesis
MPSSLNILFAHESFGSLGGAESNVFATASELKRRGHRVALLTQQPTGGPERVRNWEELFGEEVFWLGKSPGAEMARGFEADVVYMHKWEELPSIERLLKRRAPLVRMVHDHDIYCMRSYRYNPLTRAVCHRPAGAYCVFPCLAPLKRNRGAGFPIRWASYFEKQRELALNRRFDRHVVATEYMRRELLINGFDPQRIEVLPPVPPPAQPLRSSFSEHNLLVFAGQIIRGKGVDVLLRALALVQSPFELVILGEGSHRRACEKLSRRLDLQDRVRFEGFVPQAQMRAFYESATAVMVPSVWPEPMGLAGIEAMRYGLPVVAFDAGGVADWLANDENGFLVPWMNVRLFAQRIDELLSDKNKARAMGRRGLERAERDFDFHRYIDGLTDLFERVATERREPVAA